MYIPQDVVREPLYVVSVIFNPVRFKSRWALYRDFQRHVRESGAILLTVEAAFGERTYALEDHANPFEPTCGETIAYRSHGPANVPQSASLPTSRLHQDYIKIRVGDEQEIWLKENLQNLALAHLPEDAKYIAFIDADITFSRPDWVSETLHALQHYDVIQMFSTAINLSPTYEPLEANLGFGYCHINGVRRPTHNRTYYGISKRPGEPNAWHTGFAWAWRRSALDMVGGLIDWAILGAADNHMARALVGRAEESINPKISASYRNRVLEWQARAEENIKRNVGYIDGTILHRWHGRIVNRRYSDRWRILINNAFDPEIDLKRDSRGVIRLTDRKPKLRDDVRAYFRARSEDSIDVPGEDYKLVGPKPGPEW